MASRWREVWALERLIERWPELQGDEPPTPAVLAELLERSNVGFELAGPSRVYEDAVVCGRIPTREGSWHDVFNVLAFVLYPRSKAALHARCRTLAQARNRTPPRTREEDALTLIDETSLIVAGPSEAIEAFEQARASKSVTQLDAIVREHGLFVDVLGHALLEHVILARPAIGAGVLTLALAAPVTRARVDEALARTIAEGGFPKPCLSPTLPWPDARVDAWLAEI